VSAQGDPVFNHGFVQDARRPKTCTSVRFEEAFTRKETNLKGGAASAVEAKIFKPLNISVAAFIDEHFASVLLDNSPLFQVGKVFYGFGVEGRRHRQDRDSGGLEQLANAFESAFHRRFYVLQNIGANKKVITARLKLFPIHIAKIQKRPAMKERVRIIKKALKLGGIAQRVAAADAADGLVGLGFCSENRWLERA